MASNGKVFYSPQIKKILDFMDKYYQDNEAYPKLDEIGKAISVTKQRIGILMKDALKLGLVESHNVFMRKYHLTKLYKSSKLKVNNYYEL